MITTALIAALVGTATAHMEMKSPAPLNSKYNPNTDPAHIDYSMTSPLRQDGSDYPCKGYHTLLGTPAGAPTASFGVGSAASVRVVGGAAHGGGSCQVSLSTDGARTFAVLRSVVGDCPAGLDDTIGFTVPADAPPGDAVLAWSWNNRIGNREMYMNCAAVTLTGGGGGGAGAGKAGGGGEGGDGASYSSLPGIFVANVGNGCSVAEGGDVAYPDPGPDVVEQSTNPIQPAGDCGSSAPPPGYKLTKASTVAEEKHKERKGGRGRKGRYRPAESRRPGAPVAAAAEKPTGAPSRAGSRPEAGSGAAPRAPGTACADEGQWNCLPAGDSFQRCASGQWSAVMSMPAGTICMPGVTDDLGMKAAPLG